MGSDWPTRHVSGKGELYLIFVLGEGECQTLIRVIWCIHCLQEIVYARTGAPTVVPAKEETDGWSQTAFE